MIKSSKIKDKIKKKTIDIKRNFLFQYIININFFSDIISGKEHKMIELDNPRFRIK